MGFCALLALSFLVFAPARATASTTPPVGIIVPLYTYPGATWAALIQAKSTYTNVPFVAIINPASGPGSSADQNYASGVQQLQAAGITVLGYAPTNYAAAPIATVESYLSDYNTWYRVNGAFFDEMSNIPGNEAYYSALSTYSKSLGMTLTVGNPGATVPTSYLGTVDTIVTYENAGLPPLSTLSYPGVSPNSFAEVAYGVSLPSESFLTSVSSYTSWVYFTDGVLPSPYGGLPSYFSDEVSSLSSVDIALSNHMITVESSAVGGTQFSGMWTTVTSGGTVVASGFTPLSIRATSGSSYTICISNYGSYTFSSWAGGGTSSCTSVTPTTDTVLTADFNTATFSALSVNAVDSAGDPASGLYTTLSQGGMQIASGFTPARYSQLAVGQSYAVQAEDYSSCHFAYWQDTLSTSNTRQFTAQSGGQSFTAVYNCTPESKLTVLTVDGAGNPIAGYYVELSQSPAVVGTGFTPASFSGLTVGQMYTVAPQGYGGCDFNHWQDSGSTNGVRAFAATTIDETFTAVYSGTCP